MDGLVNPVTQSEAIAPDSLNEQSVLEMSRSIQELGDRLQHQHQREVNRLAGQLQEARLEAQHLRFLLDSSVKPPVANPKREPHVDPVAIQPAEQLESGEALSNLKDSVGENEVFMKLDNSILNQPSKGQSQLSLSGNNGLVKLKVSIVSAWGLRNADFGLMQGASDPYCICQPVGRPSSGIKTRVENDTLHPVWNHEGFIPSFGEDDDLEFCVYDKDLMKSDDLLGRAVLAGPMLIEEGFTGDLKLEDTGLDNDEESYLRVKVSPIKEDDTVFTARLDHAKRQWPQFVKHKGSSEKRRERLSLHRRTGHHFRRVIRCGDSTKALSEKSGFVGNFLQPLVCSPDVRKKLLWDFMGFLLVGHDVFMIPFMQAFDLAMTTPLLIIAIILAVFWTLDLIGTFFTGYIEQGLIEMRINFICRRYFQSWFIFDFMIITIDWLFIVSLIILREGGLGVPIKLLRILRSARAVRTLRMLALFRIAKAKHIISYVLKMIRHPSPQAVIKVVEAVLIVVTINHFVACAWFALARVTADDPAQTTWVKQKNFDDTSIAYQYGTALHWAITQFTPASMDVQPTNTQERYFTLLVDMFGLIVFSTFVSTITTNMTQVRALRQQKTLSAHQLKLYFRDNKVSLELARRIMSYLQPDKDSLGAGRVHLSDFAPIKGLTPNLLHDLKLEVFSPMILHHPFFYAADSITREISDRVCEAALSENAWALDDKIFEQGQEGTGMYFILAGAATYLWVGGTHQLQKDSWIAEPALWIEDWEYRGSLRADGPCESVKIDAATFRKIVQDLTNPSRSPELEHFVQMYAATFVRFSPDESADDHAYRYTDLWVSHDELKFTVERELLPLMREQ